MQRKSIIFNFTTILKKNSFLIITTLKILISNKQKKGFNRSNTTFILIKKLKPVQLLT